MTFSYFQGKLWGHSPSSTSLFFLFPVPWLSHKKFFTGWRRLELQGMPQHIIVAHAGQNAQKEASGLLQWQWKPDISHIAIWWKQRSQRKFCLCHFTHERKAVLLNPCCLFASSAWSNSNEMLPVTMANQLLLILNCKCCTEILMWSNHMTPFLHFPVDSLSSCLSACVLYCS